MYTSWQFYIWFQNDVIPAYSKSKKAGNLRKLCFDAVACGNPDADKICSQSNTSRQTALNAIAQTTSDAGFLPGTLGGGPLPQGVPDIVSSEIQGKLRK